MSQKKTKKLTSRRISLTEVELIEELGELARAGDGDKLQIKLLQAFASPHHDTSLIKSFQRLRLDTCVTILEGCRDVLQLMYRATPNELKAATGLSKAPSLNYATPFVNSLIDSHLTGLLTESSCATLLREISDIVHQFEDLCKQLQQLDGMLYHMQRERRLRKHKNSSSANGRPKNKHLAQVTRTYTLEILDLAG